VYKRTLNSSYQPPLGFEFLFPTILQTILGSFHPGPDAELADNEQKSSTSAPLICPFDQARGAADVEQTFSGTLDV
jgi:hypothetical protein